ncbi:alpha/beta fold hydrolase [Chloroflexota bacterium]
MKRAYIDIPEVQVHYRTEGSGKPFLLLHQTALSSTEYMRVIPILARRYRVIAMDTPGYGGSDLPPRAYQVEDYAKCVVNFLKAMGIGKTSIVGHHTGAAIALEVAASHSEMVDKLILSGCPYYTPEMRKERLSNPKFRPMEIKDDGSHLIRPWRSLATRYSGRANLEKAHIIFTNYLLAGPRGEEGHHAVFRYESERRLPLIKSPTLLLYGTKDTFYERREATRNLIAQCQIKIIEGGDNFIIFDMPQNFTQAILEFTQNSEI